MNFLYFPSIFTANHVECAQTDAATGGRGEWGTRYHQPCGH
jgi:hypothetical protein